MMDLPRVVWMLVLTSSLCSKVQVNTAGKSSSYCVHQDTLLDTKVRAVLTNRSSLLLTTYDRQLTIRFPTTVNNIGTGYYLTRATGGGGSEVVNARSRKMIMQPKFLKILERKETGHISMPSKDTESLRQMLVTLVQQELRECHLVLAYDSGYSGQQAVLEGLLQLPNPRQVVNINTTDDLLRIVWESSMCRGYLFLLDTLEPLLAYANTYHHTWDYSGRFVLVGRTLEHLEAFTMTNNGKKTEHVVGAVKSSTEGEWVLYMNQLYWDQGARRINTWRRHKFTHQLGLFPDKLSDLQGAVLRVSTFMFEPCIFYRRAPNGSVVSRYGVDIEVTKAVAYLLNFTAKFEEPPDSNVFEFQS